MTIKIKPLEWEYHPVGIMAAPSTGHAYIFDTRMKGHFRSIKGFNPQRDFDTLDEAKAAAQADYERRILAALEPAPVTLAQAARVLLDEWMHGEGPLGDLVCYSMDEDGVMRPDIDGRWTEFPKIEAALLRALADAGEAG